MDAPVADAGRGVGVREQPVQPGAAAALALTDPLGGLRLGLAEGGVDQRVEHGVGHALLDQPLGLMTEVLGQTGGSVEALCLPSQLDLRPVGFDDERHHRPTSALSTDEPQAGDNQPDEPRG